HIIETADGREITLSQKVRVRIRMPGVDKSSAGLISWMQPKDHGDIDSKLENSIDLEIPQPLKDVDKSSWTCGIPRLRSKITKLIADYERKIDRGRPATVEEFSMKLSDPKATARSSFRQVPFHIQKEVKEMIDDLLEKEFITTSRSPYAAPLVIVDKKTGGVRICCDYKKLNQITVSDGYPIPRQDELFAALGGQKIFAALDLKSGYYNVKIQPESQH
ncbi:hypothetical protein ADUPG1_005352, partial [Aduncisulcus paluster]